MHSFSQRFGYAKPGIDLGEDEMPDTLRNGLWNTVLLTFFARISVRDSRGRQTRFTPQFLELTDFLWIDYFRLPIDTRSGDAAAVVAQVRDYFFSAQFIQVYEFLEFLAQCDIVYFRFNGGGDEFAIACNRVLERERAAFRFAGTTLVKLINEEEIQTVADAMSGDMPKAIRQHIKRAAELYSQQPTPDYRNSIKESISAVEAAVAYVTESNRLKGVSIPLRRATEKLGVHPALRDGFEKLYAYTSDAGGIRHALLGESNLSQAEARYMVVSCSAFSNYLVALKSA